MSHLRPNTDVSDGVMTLTKQTFEILHYRRKLITSCDCIHLWITRSHDTRSLMRLNSQRAQSAVSYSLERFTDAINPEVYCSSIWASYQCSLMCFSSHNRNCEALMARFSGTRVMLLEKRSLLLTLYEATISSPQLIHLHIVSEDKDGQINSTIWRNQIQ